VENFHSSDRKSIKRLRSSKAAHDTSLHPFIIVSCNLTLASLSASNVLCIPETTRLFRAMLAPAHKLFPPPRPFGSIIVKHGNWKKNDSEKGERGAVNGVVQLVSSGFLRNYFPRLLRLESRINYAHSGEFMQLHSVIGFCMAVSVSEF
jgi:hypothetical protein